LVDVGPRSFRRRGPFRSTGGDMKRVLVIVLALAAVLVVPGNTARADQTYLREPDAPKAIFPDSTTAERRTLALSDAELKLLSEKLGRRVDAAQYPYFDVRTQNDALGVVFLLDVVGQSRPISFAIGVTSDGSLRDLQVMVYREPQGEQIQEARFRRQFAGKRVKDPLTLGKDIDVISGASISSRSATYAARKALWLAEILRGRMTADSKQ
jgi:H+/Na+-translocating ferredoxin:NAD+ oxidoreductase subunit G